MSVQRYIILTFLAIRQNWLLTNLHCKGKFIDGCLRIEIDDNNCQDNGKDAETNVKKSLDGASTKLFGHTTLETTNVMFVMGHEITIYCLQIVGNNSCKHLLNEYGYDRGLSTKCHIPDTFCKLSILTSRLKNSLLGRLWPPEASRLN